MPAPKDNTNQGRVTTPNGKATGRPCLAIDARTVYYLAKRGYTNDEIADELDVNTKTLERRFVPVLRRARSKCKSLLRARMIRSAMAGNATMQVWVSKNMLGWKDRVDHTSGDETIVKMLHGVSMADLGRAKDEPPEEDENGEDESANGNGNSNGNGHANRITKQGRRRK